MKLYSFEAFIRMNGKPFNCEDDISAYYEIDACGEIDELKTSGSYFGGNNCDWRNGPGEINCQKFHFQDNKEDDKGGLI